MQNILADKLAIGDEIIYAKLRPRQVGRKTVTPSLASASMFAGVQALAALAAVAFWPCGASAAAPRLEASVSSEPPASDGPYESPWSAGAKSAVRLIATRAPGRPYVSAGLEMRLDPGALTYWRTPGEAGAPPVFSFEGSENIADVAVFYPAPRRIDESGSEVFGYIGSVIFPIHVNVIDETRPAGLALTIRYAVCERVCLPAKAEAQLALPPALKKNAADAEASLSALAGAEAKVPVRLSDLERNEKLSVESEPGAARPTWRLTVKGWKSPDGSPERGEHTDLFAEAPDGWFYETRPTERPDVFKIIEMERPKTEVAQPPVLFTLTGWGGAYEFVMRLEPATAEH